MASKAPYVTGEGRARAGRELAEQASQCEVSARVAECHEAAVALVIFAVGDPIRSCEECALYLYRTHPKAIGVQSSLPRRLAKETVDGPSEVSDETLRFYSAATS